MELLRSGARQVEKLYILKGRRGREIDQILTQARQAGLPFAFESRMSLTRMVGGEKHQGVVAVVNQRIYNTLDELLMTLPQRAQSPLILLLDGLKDPRNLGAILRTAEAAGVDGVILPKHRSVGLTPVVSKTSAGASEYLPVVRVTNLTRTMEQLKSEGFWFTALDPAGQDVYTSADYHRPMGIVIGEEGRGIRKNLLKHCDQRVSIPMRGRVQSLNVSVALGVLLYEVIRQRD